MPAVIDATTNYSVFNHLSLDVLCVGITEQMLNSATKTNGAILISASSNLDLYNTIWNVLQGMLKVEIKKD